MAWQESAGRDKLGVSDGGVFSGLFPGPFSCFVDFNYSGNDGQITWVRVDGGPRITILNGKFTLGDWSNTFEGSTVLPIGRVRALVIGDTSAATAKSWIMPEGGAITQEHDLTNYFTNTSIFANPINSQWFAAATGPAERIYEGAWWSAKLQELLRFGLLSGGISPVLVKPESLLWRPGWDGEGDAGKANTATAAATFEYNHSGPGGSLVILKDPTTHAPVQHSSLFWGVSGGNTLTVWTSSDLQNWTDEGTLTTATDEGLSETGACDFIHDSGATRPFQVVYWGNTGGANDVFVISSSDMATWQNEMANPILSGVQAPEYDQGTNPGAEDFRVTKDDAGDWVAVFEHNEVGFGNSVGVASHSSARLASAFSVRGTPCGGNGSAIGALVSTSSIIANPVIVRRGSGDYLVFMELRDPGTSNDDLGTPTVLAKTDNPADPESYELLGYVTNASGDQSGWGRLIPNNVVLDSETIKISGPSGGVARMFFYQDWQAQFVGGFRLTAASSGLTPATVASFPSVTLNAEDRAGSVLADQSGISVWVSAARAAAPEVFLTGQSIASGQMVIDVTGAGYTNGQTVFVEAQLSTGDIATAEGTVVA